MKLLTFLGVANYQPTTYCLNEQSFQTTYCSAAVAHFCQVNTMLVVVTEAARKKHFETLAQEVLSFDKPVNPIAVDIPDAHSEADLWTIFHALTHHVTHGDDLVIDITNGFRSLPFLSFLAIVFLRMALQVNVQHIYYGAWEAKNEANESPIFNLTPFLTLLDWTIATNRFTRFGDATDLAALLREGMPPGPQMGTDLEARNLGNALKNAATAMETISEALRLTRPIETMQASQQLVDTLAQVGPLIEETAPPFATLTGQIRQRYYPLSAKDDPLAPSQWKRTLQIQGKLIKQYKEQGQLVQAITLAREWLVSLLVYCFKGNTLTHYDKDRLPVENALNNEVERHKPNPQPPNLPAYDAELQALSTHRNLAKLWDKLRQLRNDIAHVGMNLDPKTAKKLSKQFNALYPDLETVGKNLLNSG